MTVANWLNNGNQCQTKTDDEFILFDKSTIYWDNDH